MTAKPSQPFLTYPSLLARLAKWKPELAHGQAPDWQQPSRLGVGILSSSLSFRAAAAAGRNPVQLAALLADDLAQFIDSSGLPLEVATSGSYINLDLTPEGYAGLGGGDLQAGLVATDQRHVMLEYIGANVAKRLHAGHMRNLNNGEALRRILSLKYPNLVTDNHWGDWGVQFGVLIWAYKRECDAKAYDASPIDELQRLYVWGSAQEGIFEGWAEAVRAEFVKLEAGDAENRRLWQEFLAVSRSELKADLDLFGVPPTDLEQGESFYESDMKLVGAFMERYGLWQGDGAARYIDFGLLATAWPELDEVETRRVASLGRCYLISSNGYTTYAFRDVAARLQWARDHEIDLAVTVTDVRQSHNFDQAFGIIAWLATRPEFRSEFGKAVASRLKPGNLKHVGYGFLQLASGKMSTRKGNVLRLRTLVEEVEAAARDEIIRRDPELASAEVAARSRALAIGSLKWADLNRDPQTDVTLDPAAIIRFEGNTGTYQLYTYARLRNVLRRAGYEHASVGGAVKALSVETRHLWQRLYSLAPVLQEAINNYRPNLIAEHVYALSELANRWYVSAPKVVALSPDDPERASALSLIDAVTRQQKYCLSLLGIETLEQL